MTVIVGGSGGGFLHPLPLTESWLPQLPQGLWVRTGRGGLPCSSPGRWDLRCCSFLLRGEHSPLIPPVSAPLLPRCKLLFDSFTSEVTQGCLLLFLLRVSSPQKRNGTWDRWIDLCAMGALGAEGSVPAGNYGQLGPWGLWVDDAGSKEGLSWGCGSQEL